MTAFPVVPLPLGDPAAAGRFDPETGTDAPAAPAFEVFEVFAAEARPRLRRAFAARYGVDVADDVTADVLDVAWTRWPELRVMDNPIGWLYRVGQSKSRRYLRWGARPTFPVEAPRDAADRIDLFRALRKLPHRQRVAVLAVHGYGWSYTDVARILDTTEANVTNHVHRGLARLRRELDR